MRNAVVPAERGRKPRDDPGRVVICDERRISLEPAIVETDRVHRRNQRTDGCRIGNLSFSNQENEFLRNGVILSEFDGDSRLDLWVLGLKVMATGITATLSILFLVFLLSRRKPSWRERKAIWHFTLASLFATLFIGADAAVRASAVLDNVDGVLLPYRLALSALVLSIAAYVGLSWTLDPARPSSFRATAMLYACAALFAIAVWVDHPFLIIAGDAFTIRGTGVYADYGAGAPLLFALCAVLFVLMCRGLLPLAYRIGGTTVWRLTVLGFVVLFAAGVHDALLELNLMPIPVGLLPLGYACFQMGAFAVLAIHYSRTLEDRQVQGLQLRRLTDAVSRDAYTGLFSRTYLEDTLNRLGAGVAGGLLFIDLDHFKAINDTFGHASGDQVIRAVADRIRLYMRDDDVACRWGGDEFVIYLSGTDAEALGALSERLQQAFKTVGVEHFAGAQISVSMGFAELVDGDWHETLERADRAMYDAKQAGRAQFMRAENTTSAWPTRDRA